jgi:2OG-Fe(II) oxygenase superfamily
LSCGVAERPVSVGRFLDGPGRREAALSQGSTRPFRSMMLSTCFKCSATQHPAHLRQNFALSINDFDAFRRILEVFDVIVGVEGWEPHHTAKTALHPPHPIDRIGVDAADRGVQDYSAEYLEPLNMLPGKPSAIGGCRDVILEDQCVKSAFLIKTSQLDVIQGTAKDVGRGVDVRIHQPGNRANSRRWRRKDAALRKHFARIKDHPESGRAGDRNTGLEELPPRSMVARHMIAATAANMNRFGCTQRLRGRAEAISGVSYNAVLLNLYRDGSDSVGSHSDHEAGLGNCPTIASLSLGATRRFQFRHRRTKETITLELSEGLWLVMAGESQRFWVHQVPKTTAAVDRRINLTFRRMTPVHQPRQTPQWS